MCLPAPAHVVVVKYRDMSHGKGFASWLKSKQMKSLTTGAKQKVKIGLYGFPPPFPNNINHYLLATRYAIRAETINDCELNFTN